MSAQRLPGWALGSSPEKHPEWRAQVVSPPGRLAQAQLLLRNRRPMHPKLGYSRSLGHPSLLHSPRLWDWQRLAQRATNSVGLRS
jgi:hypothetical protein